MTVLAHSLDDELRLRQISRDKGVVEIRSSLRSDDRWTYCVYRSLPLEKAHELFNNQCRFHVKPAARRDR